MLGRIVYRNKLIESGKADGITNFYTNRSSNRKFIDLISHKDEIVKSTNRMHNFEKNYTELIKFYEQKYLLDKSRIFDLYCRQLINRIDIGNDDFSEVVLLILYYIISNELLHFRKLVKQFISI